MSYLSLPPISGQYRLLHSFVDGGLSALLSPAAHEGHVELCRPADPVIKEPSTLGAHARVARTLALEALAAVLLEGLSQGNLVTAVLFLSA